MKLARINLDASFVNMNKRRNGQPVFMGFVQRKPLCRRENSKIDKKSTVLQNVQISNPEETEIRSEDNNNRGVQNILIIEQSNLEDDDHMETIMAYNKKPKIMALSPIQEVSPLSTPAKR